MKHLNIRNRGVQYEILNLDRIIDTAVMYKRAYVNYNEFQTYVLLSSLLTAVRDELPDADFNRIRRRWFEYTSELVKQEVIPERRQYEEYNR